MKEKILVTGADLAPQALALLSDYDIVFAGKTPTSADIEALCKQHNPVAVIVRYNGMNAASMDAAPGLKVISKHGSGTDTIDKTAAAARGITVTAAVGANAAAVAEQATALMLACAKSLVILNERMHAGHWDKSTHKSVELSGRTVGLIGLGAIGRKFARICLALEMNVLGYDPFAQMPAGAQSASLEEIWRESDVISLHCPLTQENQQLINAQTLSQCKRGVIIVNTARGGLINEMALFKAVNTGQVGMAALDSFAVEPLTAPNIFQNHPRILMSPHIGGVTADAYVKMGVAAAQNVLAVLKK